MCYYKPPAHPSAGWEPLLLFLAPVPVPHPSCALPALAAVISFSQPCLRLLPLPTEGSAATPMLGSESRTDPVDGLSKTSFYLFFFLEVFKPKLLKALCP